MDSAIVYPKYLAPHLWNALSDECCQIMRQHNSVSLLKLFKYLAVALNAESPDLSAFEEYLAPGTVTRATTRARSKGLALRQPGLRSIEKF